MKGSVWVEDAGLFLMDLSAPGHRSAPRGGRGRHILNPDRIRMDGRALTGGGEKFLFLDGEVVNELRLQTDARAFPGATSWQTHPLIFGWMIADIHQTAERLDQSGAVVRFRAADAGGMDGC